MRPVEKDSPGRLFVSAELDDAGPFRPDDVDRLVVAFVDIGVALAATAALCDVGVTDLQGPGISSVETKEIAKMIRLAAQVVRNRREPG